MSELFCPRCGQTWDGFDACASCGYAPEHPGVLGAFRRASGSLTETPGLLALYLVPLLLLVGAQLALGDASGREELEDLGVALATLAALFLHAWWFLIAVATSTRWIVEEAGRWVPPPGVVAPCALAAALSLVPWALMTALVAWAPPGGLGAVAQLGVLVLLFVAIAVMGRMIGVPVEAGLGASSTRQALSGGNRRARENGGVGVVFLFLVGAGLLLVGMAIAAVAGLVTWSLGTRLAVVSLVLWGLEAWTGTAAVHALTTGTGPERTVTCPRCGQEASAQGGRAACPACGLEGAFYAD